MEIKLILYKVLKSEDTFTKWDKWIQVEHQKQHVIKYNISVLSHYLINVEYINDKAIEVHFRGNEDFQVG